MSTKIIYFVRHGETILNAQGIRQGAEGSLSEKGRMQALETAQKFPKNHGKPNIIISSPFDRAKETAEIIAKELHIDNIEYCDLLVERKNPTEIIGHKGTEESVKHIVDIMDKSFHDNDMRYSDEENFIDLRNRADKLLCYIKDRPEHQIIMVTHSIFLKLIVAYLLLGKKLTASEYNNLSYLNDINNAGLTICTYTTHLFKKSEWKLLAWNDQLQMEAIENS